MADSRHISTSYIERQNLTMRMHMRRFTRLTNAFSKKIENHAHNVAIHFMYYNFCRVHQTLRVTPAMETGLAKSVWEIDELAALSAEARYNSIVKRFRRWLFNGMAAISLVLGMATAMAWMTGYGRLHVNSGGRSPKWDFDARGWGNDLVFTWTLTGRGSWVNTNYYNARRNFLGFGANHLPQSAAPPGFHAANVGVVILPLWLPLLVSAILPLLWLRRWKHRRNINRSGLCAFCGYDLRATPDRCPECGTIPAKPQS